MSIKLSVSSQTLLGTSYGFRRKKSNRYYAFRNLDRLKSLKKYNFFFGFLKILSLIAIYAGIVALFIWILLVVFTLGKISQNEWLTVLSISWLGGLGLLVISNLLQYVIEFSYMKAEKRELTKIPEGAEKYLKVMAAVNKIKKANVISILFALLAAIMAVVTNFSEVGIVIFFVVVVSAFIASQIIVLKTNNSICTEVDEIKLERRAIKQAMKED